MGPAAAAAGKVFIENKLRLETSPFMGIIWHGRGVT
jgi:hypothetical protein